MEEPTGIKKSAPLSSVEPVNTSAKTLKLQLFVSVDPLMLVHASASMAFSDEDLPPPQAANISKETIVIVRIIVSLIFNIATV